MAWAFYQRYLRRCIYTPLTGYLLRTSAFWKIPSEVLPVYKTGGNHIKEVAYAMMIKMRDLIVSKVNDGEVIVSGSGIMGAIHETVHLHNSAFSKLINQFTPSSAIVSTGVKHPTAMFVSMAPQQRLKQKTDQYAFNEGRDQEMSVLGNWLEPEL